MHRGTQQIFTQVLNKQLSLFFPADMQYKVSQETNDSLIQTHCSSTSVEGNEKFKNHFQINQEIRAPSRQPSRYVRECLGTHSTGALDALKPSVTRPHDW